jgi:hypothetical protein
LFYPTSAKDLIDILIHKFHLGIFFLLPEKIFFNIQLIFFIISILNGMVHDCKHVILIVVVTFETEFSKLKHDGVLLFLFLYDYLSYESLTSGYVAAALLINVMKRIQKRPSAWHILRTKIKGGVIVS